MKLAIKTCTLDMPYEQMLDFCVEQRIAAIEIGTGIGRAHRIAIWICWSATGRRGSSGMMQCGPEGWNCARSIVRATHWPMNRRWM